MCISNVLSMFTLWISCGPWALLGPPGAILGGLGGAKVGLGGAQGGSREEMVRPRDAPGRSRGTGCRPQGGLGGPSNAQMSVLER